MNILKAIQSLKPNCSVTIEHAVLSRLEDTGGKANFKITYPCGSTKEDWILSRMLNRPAYVLELIWAWSTCTYQAKKNCWNGSDNTRLKRQVHSAIMTSIAMT